MSFVQNVLSPRRNVQIRLKSVPGVAFLTMLYLHDFSSLQLFYNDGGEHGDEVLYGTIDGKIGFVHLTRCEALELLRSVK